MTRGIACGHHVQMRFNQSTSTLIGSFDMINEAPKTPEQPSEIDYYPALVFLDLLVPPNAPSHTIDRLILRITINDCLVIELTRCIDCY